MIGHIFYLLIGIAVGGLGLFLWARYHKEKAIALIGANLQELWKFIDDEVLGDLDENVAKKIKELFDKIFGNL